MKPVVCRVAPSPTGNCHLGTARTALYSFLMARRHGGTFIIRMEDTDAARSTKEFEKDILDSLAWLGITSDVPIVRQSERNDLYKKYVQILLDKGLAYKCYCTSEELEQKRAEQEARKEKPLYDRTCYGKKDQPGKPYVVRFKVPEYGSVRWRDCVLGTITVLKSQISDFIIQRQDGSVGYLLANMIDDALQGVTHIVRGIDGMNNAPAQIMLFEALGFDVPIYAHTPFILNDKGDKLSKRNGDASVMDYKNAGLLPEALINALARLGWSHGNDELFSMDDLIEKFDLNHVSKSAASLDPKKFEHINKHWLKVGNPERIADLLRPFLFAGMVPEGWEEHVEFPTPNLVQVVQSLQSRTVSLKDMAEKAKFYYRSDFAYEKEISDKEKLYLCALIVELREHKKIDAESVEHCFNMVCKRWEISMKEIGPAVRMALSGRSCAPPVVDMVTILGKDETIARLQRYAGGCE